MACQSDECMMDNDMINGDVGQSVMTGCADEDMCVMMMCMHSAANFMSNEYAGLMDCIERAACDMVMEEGDMGEGDDMEDHDGHEDGVPAMCQVPMANLENCQTDECMADMMWTDTEEAEGVMNDCMDAADSECSFWACLNAGDGFTSGEWSGMMDCMEDAACNDDTAFIQSWEELEFLDLGECEGVYEVEHACNSLECMMDQDFRDHNRDTLFSSCGEVAENDCQFWLCANDYTSPYMRSLEFRMFINCMLNMSCY